MRAVSSAGSFFSNSQRTMAPSFSDSRSTWTVVFLTRPATISPNARPESRFLPLLTMTGTAHASPASVRLGRSQRLMSMTSSRPMSMMAVRHMVPAAAALTLPRALKKAMTSPTSPEQTASGPCTISPKSLEQLRPDHPPLRAYVLDGADVVQRHQGLAEIPAQADDEKVRHAGQLYFLFQVLLHLSLCRLAVTRALAQSEPLRDPANVGVHRDHAVAERE